MDSNPLSQFADRLVRLMDFEAAALDFDALALELFRLQYQHNATYAKVCRAQGRVPESVREWKEIPTLPAVAFKEFEVTSIPPEMRTAVFYSSGTTATQASRHFHGAASLRLYEASARAWLTRSLSVLGPFGSGRHRVWSLTPPPNLAPHSSLVHMFGAAGDWLNDPGPVFWGAIDAEGAWRLDIERLLGALREVDLDSRPIVLLGTAFLFVHLIDALEAAGGRWVLPAGSLVFETGGYKGRSRAMPRQQLHGQITRWLGVNPRQIVCEYGMSELSSQAYALRETSAGSSPDRLFRFPPWVRTVIRSPETGREVPEGERGLLQIWDLANVWSVMGIQTEDLATSWSGAFELHGRAVVAPPRGCSLMAA